MSSPNYTNDVLFKPSPSLDRATANKGDLLVRDTSEWIGIAAAAAGKVLTSNGALTLPTWETPSGGYTAEQAQDAVGGILTDTTSINLTYNDGADTITADIVDRDYGDIVVSGTGATWTIDTNAVTTTKIADDNVTYAKIQNVSAADTLLGRGNGGAGDVQEITLGSGLTMTGTTLASTSGYTDEQAQDAIGAMIDGSLTYVDGTPLLQRSALTGDVTATAGSNTTTIANDAVTYAKMQNVSTGSRLLGRGDSGGGDVQEITVGSGLSMTGTTLSSVGGTPYYTWNVVSGTSQSAAVNNAYVTGNAGLTTVTLPASAAVGDGVLVTNYLSTTGGVRIGQNSGQRIILPDGNATTTGVGGYLDSSGEPGYIELVCIVANNDWLVIGGNSNFSTNTGSFHEPITLNGDVTGSTTSSGNYVTTAIANNAVTTAKIANSNVTLAKIANAAANSKIIGSGASGSGSSYSELALGTNLSMSGTTLNAASVSVAIHKTADESVTSSAALQDDNDLLFSIGASETWAFLIIGSVTYGTTGLFKYDFSVPSGASGRTFSSADGSAGFANSAIGTPVSFSGSAQTNSLITISGYVVNSSTPGTVRLQWAQAASNGTASTLKQATILIATKIS